MNTASLSLLLLTAAQPADAINDANELALKAAVARVAPSIVQVETSGGTEMIAGRGDRGFRKGTGPTTGVVVGADGYILSSAFNFANKPSSIVVAIPGRKERLVAKVIATDHTRMLTLLKVDATGLPTPPGATKAETRIGQWAVAAGRTLDPNPEHLPSMSVGVVSALNRIWGKALQTDAKVSPANYGGPLVDIEGRVLGILVPASPQGEGEAAGVEWYDSGIGFAIPFEDALASAAKLKAGKDLRRGMLGVTPKTPDRYGVPPTVGTVAPESAAAKAGIKSGDIILEIDGKPVAHQTQLLTALGPKYEGDVISVKIKRDKTEMKFEKVELRGLVSSFQIGYLGIVPVRDDPELGVEVRYVEPNSPADKAGIKPGDRLMKVGPADAKTLEAFSGRDELRALLDTDPAGTELKFEVVRMEGKKTETVKVKLGTIPDDVPEKLPPNATAKRALEPRKKVAPKAKAESPQPVPIPGKDGKGKAEPKKEEPKPEEPKKDEAKKAETGLLERTSPAKDKQFWVYVPANYDPNIAHALVIWLHAANHAGKDAKDMVSIWESACEEQHIILVGPKSESESGWLASEAEFVQEAVRDVLKEFTIDRQRIVAHGLGVGGQMAFYLGFNARELVRGVAPSGAVLANAPKEVVPGQRLSFFIVAGGKDPLAKEIADVKPKLTEKKYPVAHREVADMGKEYLDRKTFEELLLWIDSLDRL
ncbi:MAG: PDZ domain-containing protein [Gemmataceae bacterium]